MERANSTVRDLFPEAGWKGGGAWSEANLDPEIDDKKVVKSKAAWEFMSKAIPSKMRAILFHLSPQVVQQIWCAAARPTATRGPSVLLQVLVLQIMFLHNRAHSFPMHINKPDFWTE